MNRYLLCILTWGCFAASLGAQSEDESVPVDPPSRMTRPAPRRPAAPPSAERPAPPVRRSAPQPATTYSQAAPAYGEGTVFDDYPGDAGFEDFGVGDCGPGGCGPGGCGPNGCAGSGLYGCYPGCRLAGPVYGSVDYLMWWTEGMRIPPLVITNPNITGATPAAIVTSAGALLDLNPANTSTRILYGNERVLNDLRSGGRVRLGMMVGPCGCDGIEGEYFGLGDLRQRFAATSPGTPALGRPFFDPNPAVTDPYRAELVALEGNVAGTVAVDTLSRFWGLGARWRRTLMCEQTVCDDWCGCPIEGSRRADLIVGWRYLKLDEELNIQENLQTLPNNGLNQGVGTFQVNDRFHTFNDFNGVDFGFLWQNRRGCWTVDLNTKLAAGVMHQRASIFGQTSATPAGGATQTGTGGLLAQSTNIGDHSRNVFAVVPEFGLNLGYHWSPCVRMTFGYTFLYMSNVVRPGTIIDTQVDSRLLPLAGNDPAGATRPQFRWVDDDLWAQGMNFGMQFDY